MLQAKSKKKKFNLNPHYVSKKNSHHSVLVVFVNYLESKCFRLLHLRSFTLYSDSIFCVLFSLTTKESTEDNKAVLN